MTLTPETQKLVDQLAIERAKRAFLMARTPFARHKALRKLEQLGVGPPKVRA
jgi:hypothetical protein